MSAGGSDNHHPLHERLPEPPRHSLDEPTTPRVLLILSSVVEKLVARNDKLMVELKSGSSVENHLRKSLDTFHGVRTPGISISKYLERIYKYTNCSPSCFVVGYMYIDRLVHRYPDFLVVSLNVHRLLVTCIMVASKMLDDEHYNNAFFARVGGVTNAELNRLEVELLFMLDFGLNVSSGNFECYCQHLEKQVMIFDDGLITNGVERLTITNSIDDITELSVENDVQSSSPSEI
ncbi:hypothetical protein Leryth_001303 [Lithospermum erythrorhizon]|uniref:Cyclin n=1 Tax=Lithospermum erythrorhizon TaxID=34254 RepID=A0AAV3NUL0_LITER|nr:hypothetical protein Leryth_001303 [Lithospermum erythrorhizon]